MRNARRTSCYNIMTAAHFRCFCDFDWACAEQTHSHVAHWFYSKALHWPAGYAIFKVPLNTSSFDSLFLLRSYWTRKSSSKSTISIETSRPQTEPVKCKNTFKIAHSPTNASKSQRQTQTLRKIRRHGRSPIR